MLARFNATVAKLGVAALGIGFALSFSGLAQAGQSGAPELQAQAAGGDDALVQKGRQLFNDWSCSACHALKDADASGPVGPGLDGNPNLTRDLVHARIANGQGQMPGFAGQMTDDEIDELTDYILKVAIKS